MKHIFFFLICFVPVLAYAFDTQVVGHVIDEKSGEHIPFINLKIKGTTLATTTDASGHYKLENPGEGKKTLIVTGVGYTPVEKDFIVEKGKTVQVNFQVSEDLISLNEVVVSSNRNETNRKKASVVVGVIGQRTLETTNSVCLAQGLSYQTGLRMESSCQNCGFQQVRINGLEGPYSQILIDSRPIFSALSGVYGIEQIPVNMIERVEVVRGGGSALYGSNAIAGTINVITKEPVNNLFSLSHNLEYLGKNALDNVFNANASIVNADRLSGMYLYGSYRNRDHYDHDGDGYSEIPMLNSSSIGFNSYYKLNTQSKINLEFHHLSEFRRGGNKFELQPHQSDITEQVNHDINGGGISYNWFSQDYSSKLNLYASMQKIDRGSYYGAGRDTAAYGSTKDLTGVAGAQFYRHISHFLFMPADLTLGTEYQFDDLQDLQPAYQRNMHQKTVIGGFFVQNEWVSERWNILIGARMDKHNLLNNPILSPRGNIKYNLTENLHLRASVSTGFRAPQAFDEDLHIEAVNGNVQLIRLADGLKPERSNSLSSSLDYYFTLGTINMNVMAEGFHTNINDVFVLQKIGTDAGGNSILERQNGTGAKVSGINLEGKAVPSSRTRMQFGYTFQKSQYVKPEAWSDNTAVASVTKMLRSPDNYGYFTYTHEPFRRVTISASGTYTGSMVVPHFAGYVPLDVLQKTPDFFDAGFKLSYDIRLSSQLGLEISGGMKNIFNSYQNDFDRGGARDAGYIYGPSQPRSSFVSFKISNLSK